MPTYVWKGRNRYGDFVEGERAARSAEDLAANLRREQMSGVQVSPKRAGLKIPLLDRQKIKLKDLAVYSRQLSVLIDSELPLIQSLNILAEQTKVKHFHKVIKRIKEDVEAGSSLNQAKRKFATVFDDLYCNLVASGEQSGSLDTMLNRLADYLENIVKLKAKVKQALVYPLAVLGFSCLVIIFMMWKVVPVFSNIFLELGADLPFLTAIVVAISGFIQKYILVFFVGLIVMGFILKHLRQTDSGRRFFDLFSLRLPLFGKILQKVGLSRVTRTMSTLLSGGIPMMEALRITSSTAGNSIVEEKIMQARTMVAEGKSLTEAFQKVGYFPFMLTQMMSVGETTGNLDEMLTKSADFYDDEVEASVSTLLSLLEPLLLITVGGLVGFLVISMYLPIFSLMQSL